MVNPMRRYRDLKAKATGVVVDRECAALSLGISRSLVVSIENGHRTISRDTAGKIVADVDVGQHFNKGELVCWEPSPAESESSSLVAA